MQNLRWGTRGALAPVSLLVLLFLSSLPPASAAAQQFAVDDAAITERGACQVEAWWGQVEAWVLPACTLLPRTELTAGLAHLDAGSGARQAHGVVEAKWIGRDADASPWGWGLVAGAALPFDGGTGPTSAWIYAPLTVHASGIPATLHLNGGWGVEREIHGEHAHETSGLSWGLRGDVGLASRTTLIGEFYGLAGQGAELQVGIRTELVPERLGLDLSWATSLSRGDDGPGFQVGLAWTPSPLIHR